MARKFPPITITAGDGVSEKLLTNFCTAIYRTMGNPQNYTGENPLWQSEDPYFDSYYCIWDEFKAVFPLLTIVDPATVTELIRSLFDIPRHLGWLPDCRVSLCNG
jgi:putative alpha-1,2-mannosidase